MILNRVLSLIKISTWKGIILRSLEISGFCLNILAKSLNIYISSRLILIWLLFVGLVKQRFYNFKSMGFLLFSSVKKSINCFAAYSRVFD